VRTCCVVPPLAALAVLGMLLSGCAPQPEVRIGLLAMLSGANASNGESMRAAATLAIERARTTLSVDGRKPRLSLFVEDDGGSPDAALEAARRLIYKQRVAVIVGPQFSSAAIPVARLAEQEHVVMVAPMSTNPETTAGKRYVFRIPYVDTFQGGVLARFARDRLKAVRASVLYDVSSTYNRTLAEMFVSAFQAAGGIVVAAETYTADGNKDFLSQLARIGAAGADVLVLPNYAADVLSQARQARAAGVKAVLLGGDGWDGRSFGGVAELQGSYFVTPWHPDAFGGAAREFVAAYRQANGREPDEVAATTYDAVAMLLEAIGRAGGTVAEALRGEICAADGYRGVTGRLRYVGGGDPEKSAVIVTIAGGKAGVYSVVEP
jgi:branched-chain amino acid transport system substrate-binding protein